MHAAAGSLIPNGTSSSTTGSTQINTSTRPEVIVVDDDDNLEPSPKRARMEDNEGTPRKSPYQKRFHGCSICRSPHNHAAASCPVVQAGPHSIME
jgi:hypothetical protein